MLTSRATLPSPSRWSDDAPVIVGIGVDIVDVARLERALLRAPQLVERLFTPTERALPLRSLAARFAAKEAVAKALGSPGDLSWSDVEVVTGEQGEPHVVVGGRAAKRAADRGITTWFISLSHDGGMAIAMVVAST